MQWAMCNIIVDCHLLCRTTHSLHTLMSVRKMKFISPHGILLLILLLFYKKKRKPEDHWSCIPHLRSSFILSDLGQSSKNNLAPGAHLSPCTHLVISLICQLLCHGLQYFWVIHHLSLSPSKCISNQSWPLRKKVKGQTRVIIWTNLVVLVPNTVYHVSMISAIQFCRRRFLKVFTICMGLMSISVMWPKSFIQSFVPSSKWILHLIGLVVSKKMWFENVDKYEIWVNWTKIKEWPWPHTHAYLHVFI